MTLLDKISDALSTSPDKPYSHAVNGWKSYCFLLENAPIITHALRMLPVMEALQAEVPELREKVKAQEWQPTYCEVPKGIHHNPSAKDWAGYFVSVFPQFKHQEDLMLSWFANAMMAMHDHIKNEPPKGESK